MDLYENIRISEPVKMGFMASHMFKSDPKHLAFTAARYKFVAKMLEGKKYVLEVGAGDGFFSEIVRQHVDDLLLTDVQGQVGHDMTKAVFNGGFDGGYALDVLEHIPQALEGAFLANFRDSVEGPVIIGIPALEFVDKGSPLSQLGHVNCKTKEGLRRILKQHFREVFMFAMNDEVIHTGDVGRYYFGVGV